MQESTSVSADDLHAAEERLRVLEEELGLARESAAKAAVQRNEAAGSLSKEAAEIEGALRRELDVANTSVAEARQAEKVLEKKAF